MEHKQTLDKLMGDLLKNPYCKRILKESVLPSTIEIPPEIILGLRYNNSDYGNVIRGAYMEILEKHNGNVSKVCKVIGVSQRWIYNDLNKYGLVNYGRLKPKQ